MLEGSQQNNKRKKFGFDLDVLPSNNTPSIEKPLSILNAKVESEKFVFFEENNPSITVGSIEKNKILSLYTYEELKILWKERKLKNENIIPESK